MTEPLQHNSMEQMNKQYANNSDIFQQTMYQDYSQHYPQAKVA